MQHLSPKFSNMLTERAKKTIERSFSMAKKYPHKNGGQVTTAHLFYALYKEKGSLASNILDTHNLKEQQFINYFKADKTKQGTNKTKQTTPTLTLSSSYKTALKKAAKQAMMYGHPLIGTEHLLYGTVTRLNSFKGISDEKIVDIKSHLDELMAQSMPLNSVLDISQDKNTSGLLSFEKEIINMFDKPSSSEQEDDIDSITSLKVKKTTPQTSVLDSFCEDLTEKAENGELDPLVGREKELDRLVRILARRNKNNPLLVGDAGVGKTALANGLAQRIVDGKAPEQLLDKRIFSLDLSSLLSGTVYRGEFEERMHDLIDEASSNEVIIFIDEIHMMVGAGAAQGSLDAANILKPALARGDFQCVGATTYEEFKKTIERDSALDRRFQKVFLKEQTRAEALLTLQQLRSYYEKHHAVTIPNSILSLCIDLAVKHMPSRALPDKALDVLDEAASHARGRKKPSKKEQGVLDLEKEIKKIIQDKDTAIKNEHYKKALLAKNRQDTLEDKLKEIKKGSPSGGKQPKITKEDVYHVVADITGVPINSLSQDEGLYVENIKKCLKKDLVGQKEAVDKIVNTLKRNKAGIKNSTRPMGSFLFLGPSGTGKTFTAKVLANAMAGGARDAYRNPDTLIKLDMSEFSEPHSISRLVGAPPGYVGYEEAGLLIDKIRRNPYSVVVFDEIEKAHPQMFNILLQILEDGKLTDSHGKSADFRSSFIVLTSNIGSMHSNQENPGFSSSNKDSKKQASISALKNAMRPEIINRLDNVIVFETLTSANLAKIAKEHTKELASNMKNIVAITYEKDVYPWIVEKALKEAKGARGIRQVIEREIEEPLAEIILSDTKKRKVSVGIKDNKISIKNVS